jgi:hypothetical protein
VILSSSECMQEAENAITDMTGKRVTSLCEFACKDH